MATTTSKRTSSLRRLLMIAGLCLGVLILAAVAYLVFDPFGGYIGDPFSQEIAGLPAATTTTVVDLHDGDSFELKLSPVQKRIGNATVRMLAYNGSVPGPTLRVAQGSSVTVRVTNQTDVDTTVHWHGLRLDSQYDGIPQVDQSPIAPGQSFTYHLRFPDAGVYWYHPHIREDYTQAAGLYGNIVVVPADPSYWEKANREQTIVLSDILLEAGKIAPVSRSTPHQVAMGRFGNTMLLNGGTEYSLEASLGEVIRLYLTNTANVRPFAFRIPGARMKLVGGDGGRVEREQFVDEVVLAPAERAVVDVLFDQAGDLPIEHRTPDHTYTLGTVRVAEHPAEPAFEREFWTLRTNPDFEAFRASLAADLARPADKTLAIVGEMPGMGHGAHEAGNEAGSIEWDDTMAQMNRDSTPENMVWKLIDRQTGAENGAIHWQFHVGDRVKIKIVNALESDHLMQHPFHVHGQRFLVLSRDGAPTNDLVWKDTVLVGTGETIEILLDVSNPGTWMAHCHIAEHLESGMMFHFHVTG
jgi:FtsP/CotA-like multicopper oxidase with cupredoxin domain